MSFASKLKVELSKSVNESQCCRDAELYGMMLFAYICRNDNIRFQTENKNIAERISQLLYECVDIIVKPTQISTEGLYIINITDPGLLRLIFGWFPDGHIGISLRINRDVIESNCCMSAFIRGVFLSCGSISDPKKGYHLEFNIQYTKLSNDFVEVLKNNDFVPKKIIRKFYHVIYIKESETIEDLLTFMGASQSFFDFTDIKIEKEIRNNVNRVTNCELSNIEKSAYAAVEQLKVIEKLYKAKIVDTLPAHLMELANLRIANPDLSLKELGELTDPPLSKSGVNHRMKNIMKYAAEIKDDKKS